MNLLPMILYLLGIIGIIISLLLIVLAIKRGAKSSLNLISIVFLLSVLLMCSGAGINFLKNMQISDESTKEISSHLEPINEEVKTKEASINDLQFNYKLAYTGSSSTKNAEITIDNKSDCVFNGEIKLTFKSSSNSVTDTLVLPIKNFMPSTSYKPKALVSSSADNVDYSFSGTFDDQIDENIPFSIKKITVGNNFFRFDVTTDDASSQNLQNICDQFSNEYDSSLCDGFLIYFYPSTSSENINFNDAIGDFYVDNISHKSKLIIY